MIEVGRMRVLVIGGAGVLGRMTIPSVTTHHHVRVLDHAPSPVESAELIVGDAGDPEVVTAAIEGVDAVVHQAVVVPRGHEATDPHRVAAAFDVNVTSVYLAVTAAIAAGVTTFVHVSSLAVFTGYGTDRIGSGAFPDAIAPYGLTKRLGEDVCSALLGGEAPVLPGACSLRLGHPTPDADWPRWRPPVGDVQDLAMADGTRLPALSGADAARAILAALDYRGSYRAFPITGDDTGAAIDQRDSRDLLGWVPQKAR